MKLPLVRKALDSAEQVLKAHVKAHTRTSKTGKTSTVREHDDKREKSLAAAEKRLWAVEQKESEQLHRWHRARQRELHDDDDAGWNALSREYYRRLVALVDKYNAQFKRIGSKDRVRIGRGAA